MQLVDEAHHEKLTFSGRARTRSNAKFVPSCSIKFTIDFIFLCFCSNLNFECFASFCSLHVDFVVYFFSVSE